MGEGKSIEGKEDVMALLADIEIKQAIESGEIQIDPFNEIECLQPASYDVRIGEIIKNFIYFLMEKAKTQEQKWLDNKTRMIPPNFIPQLIIWSGFCILCAIFTIIAGFE